MALDGKPLRTPAKHELTVPSETLAAAIAAEWDAQDPDIRPHTMPLTRLAATAIDRTAAKRGEIVAEIANYAGTDLVCYRAEHPPALAARQEAAWQPLIDWAAGRYDAGLAVTAGIVPQPQSPAALNAFAAAVGSQDDFRLNALQAVTASCGSLVIARWRCSKAGSTPRRRLPCRTRETFQIEAWGGPSRRHGSPPAVSRRPRAVSGLLVWIKLSVT